MKKTYRFLAPLTLFASFVTPLFAFAQINTTYIQGYSNSITSIINTILVPLLIAVAFITFLYGVYKYFIAGAASDGDRATGRQFVLWGIIGFVVILSVWGLVNIVQGTLGLTAGNAPAFPTIGNATGSTGNSNNPSLPTSNVGSGTGSTGGGATTGVTAAQQAAATSAYQSCVAQAGGVVTQQCYNAYQSAVGQSSSSNSNLGLSCQAGDGQSGVCAASGTCDSSSMPDGISSCGTGNVCCVPSSANCQDTLADNYNQPLPCTYNTLQANCEDGGGVFNPTSHSCSAASGNPSQTQSTNATAQANCEDGGGVWDSSTNTCALPNGENSGT